MFVSFSLVGSGGRLISLSGLAEIHQRASHNVLIIAKPIIAILFVFLFVIKVMVNIHFGVFGSSLISFALQRQYIKIFQAYMFKI